MVIGGIMFVVLCSWYALGILLVCSMLCTYID